MAAKDKFGRSPLRGSGHSPKGGAASASPAKPSVPNAATVRRTFKPFAQAPRDGTPFTVPRIYRYNPLAKTFEALMRGQYSGELEWVPYPHLWSSRYFCELLPLSFEPPKAFAVTFVAKPVRRKTWRERLMDRMFGWLRVPDTVSMMSYCWRVASAMSAGTAETEGLRAKPASAAPQEDARNGNSTAQPTGDLG